MWSQSHCGIWTCRLPCVLGSFVIGLSRNHILVSRPTIKKLSGVTMAALHFIAIPLGFEIEPPEAFSRHHLRSIATGEYFKGFLGTLVLGAQLQAFAVFEVSEQCRRAAAGESDPEAESTEPPAPSSSPDPAAPLV